MIYFIDIDGTLADAGWRFRVAGPEPDHADRENHTKWVTEVQDEARLLMDSVVPGMREMVRCLSADYQSFYLTSREEKYRWVTYRWLEAHGFPKLELIMRPNGDEREAGVMKESVIRAYVNRRRDTVMVIDDDPKGDIETVCHKNGWTFLKAKSGSK